jgi:FlaA1/EpsC-like NDP-sugar epimerase
MLMQLPIIVALTSFIFLFIGMYKGYVKYDKVREVYSIFNAICLTNILTIILVVVNGKLFAENNLMVPLSIIVVHSILSFTALVASRYSFKYFASARSKLYDSSKKSILLLDENLNDAKIDAIINLIKKGRSLDTLFIPVRNFDTLSRISAEEKLSIEDYYVHKDFAKDISARNQLLKDISNFNKPVYLVEFNFKIKETSQENLILKRLVVTDENLKNNNESGEGKVVVLEPAV